MHHWYYFLLLMLKSIVAFHSVLPEVLGHRHACDKVSTGSFNTRVGGFVLCTQHNNNSYYAYLILLVGSEHTRRLNLASGTATRDQISSKSSQPIKLELWKFSTSYFQVCRCFDFSRFSNGLIQTHATLDIGARYPPPPDGLRRTP